MFMHTFMKLYLDVSMQWADLSYTWLSPHTNTALYIGTQDDIATNDAEEYKTFPTL